MAVDRRTWFKLAAVTLSSGAALGAGELGSRLLLGRGLLSSAVQRLTAERDPFAREGQGQLTEAELQRAHKVVVGGRWPLAALRFNPDITFFDYTPNVSVPVHKLNKPAELDFHSCMHAGGYRVPLDHDRDAPERGGVLFLGCSFTYGDEVNAEDTYAHKLGARLKVPAFNFGGCAYSYVTALERFDSLAASGALKALQPRAVVVGAWQQLARRSLSPFYPTYSFQMRFPYLRPSGEELVIARPKREESIDVVLRFLAAYFPDGRREGELTDERRALLQKLARSLVPNEQARARFELPRLAHERFFGWLAGQLAQRSEESGLPFAVLWMNSDPKLDKGQRPALASACEAKKLPFVEGDRWPGPYHPRPEMHSRWAEQLEGPVSRLL